MRSARMLALAVMMAAGAGSPAMLRAQTGDRFITLELEKTGLTRCRVLNSWTSGDGAKCMQLQAVGSNAMMTVVQASHGVSGASDVNVYPWGPGGVSPPGVPTPLDEIALKNLPIQTVGGSGMKGAGSGSGMKGAGSGMKGGASRNEASAPAPQQPIVSVPEAPVPVEPAPKSKPSPVVDIPSRPIESSRPALETVPPPPGGIPAFLPNAQVTAQPGAQPNTISIMVSLPGYPGFPPTATAAGMTPIRAEAVKAPPRESAFGEWASNPEVLKALLHSLNTDSSAAVRAAAAKALGKIGNSGDEVVQALLRQRNDADAAVRSEVDRAIVLIMASKGELTAR